MTSLWPEGHRFTPLPPEQDDEWADAFRDSGYDWCRPCGEWHRPPECWVDENGVPALDQPWTDADSE